MKRCAIYARFSTEMQRTTSLEDQIRNCRKFAAQMGWEVLDQHVYQDTALSGFGVEHRPAYQRLVAAAVTAAPPFTVILVDDLSRHPAHPADGPVFLLPISGDRLYAYAVRDRRSHRGSGKRENRRGPALSLVCRGRDGRRGDPEA